MTQRMPAIRRAVLGAMAAVLIAAGLVPVASAATSLTASLGSQGGIGHGRSPAPGRRGG